MAGRFNLGDSVSGIRSLLGDSPSPLVTAEINPDVAQSLGRIGGDDARRVYERLVARGTDEQTAAIIARGVETGVPQELPRGPYREAVRPPVFDPDTGRYLDTLRIRGVEAPRAPEPDFSLDSPLFRDMYKADMAYDNLRKGRTRNLRNAGGELAAIAQDNIRTAAQRSKRAGSRLAPAAAVAGAGAGLGLMLAPKNLGLTESGNPADLRDEPESASDILSRPEVPMVPQEDIRIPKKTFYEMDGRPFDESVRGGRPEAELMQPVPQPADYSMQAREMINKLNAMRRSAGGEVPEAPAMMREINRLMELGNRQRNQPGYQIPASDPARDPYQQAKTLIARVNDMYRAGYTPNSPEVQRIMADVRRLHAEGDAIRNRRAG